MQFIQNRRFPGRIKPSITTRSLAPEQYIESSLNDVTVDETALPMTFLLLLFARHFNTCLSSPCVEKKRMMMMMMMNSRRMSLRHKRTRRSRARPLERLQWTRDVHLARVTRARTLRTCARVCACACARVFFFFFLRFDQ